MVLHENQVSLYIDARPQYVSGISHRCCTTCQALQRPSSSSHSSPAGKVLVILFEG